MRENVRFVEKQSANKIEKTVRICVGNAGMTNLQKNQKA